MAEKTPQTFKNHTRLDPPFHFFLAPITMALFFWSVVNLVRNFGLAAFNLFVLSAAAVVAIFKIRLYALKVQDRVIRLEERLRLHSLLPEPLRARVNELTDDQFVGLRFASDEEVASLMEQALANHWDRKQIKQAIKTWRPDYLRV